MTDPGFFQRGTNLIFSQFFCENEGNWVGGSTDVGPTLFEVKQVNINRQFPRRIFTGIGKRYNPLDQLLEKSYEDIMQ